MQLSELRTQRCLSEDLGLIPCLAWRVMDLVLPKLQCSSQTQLRSGISSSCNSDSTPGWGTSIYCRCDHKKKKRVGVGSVTIFFMAAPGTYVSSWARDGVQAAALTSAAAVAIPDALIYCAQLGVELMPPK